MLRHYFKIAFRNLWKYKSQSIISIVGLAIGFTCFALSLFWIRHERSFDNFHPKADQIYRIRLVDQSLKRGFTSITPYPLAEYLKKNLPEIESATSLSPSAVVLRINGKPEVFYSLQIDPFSQDVFDFSKEPIRLEYPPVAEMSGVIATGEETIDVVITRRAALKIFGKEDVMGEEINDMYWQRKIRIKQVIDSWPVNTNMPFDFIEPIQREPHWNMSYCWTYVLLQPGISVKDFEKKLNALKIEEMKKAEWIVTPITSIRYELPDDEPGVKYTHIRLFSLLGILVMLCALINYLTLFVSRIQMRGKEMALRKVNGSSGKHLVALLNIEFLITFLISILLSIIIMASLLVPFEKMSGIIIQGSGIYGKIALYALCITIIAGLIATLPIQYFRRQTLQSGIRRVSVRRKNIFGKAGILVQLTISLGFIFCTLCMMKQIYHLNHVELGFNRHNIGKVSTSSYNTMIPYVNGIRQLSTIEEVLESNESILPRTGRAGTGFTEWEGKPDDKFVSFEMMYISDRFLDFYEMTILKGENFNENTTSQEMIINETAAKTFGWADPIGKTVGNKTIKGVVKDFYIDSPTEEVKPTLFYYKKEAHDFVFKYKENTRKETEAAISQLLQKDFPSNEIAFSYMDDVYRDFCKSENTLITLLTILSGVCLLISIFGTYSMVTLSCEQRRKEIAIRKVNGAFIRDILILFFKENSVLLIIASLIAFPISYKIMQPWIEQYIHQTGIDWWMYSAVFLVIAVIIMLAIIGQVWRAANRNPAEVVKSE